MLFYKTYKVTIHFPDKDVDDVWNWIPPLNEAFSSLNKCKNVYWQIVEKSEDNTEVWVEYVNEN